MTVGCVTPKRCVVSTGCTTPATLWLVVPCFNEEEVLPQAASCFAAKLSTLIRAKRISPQSRILFVDDGSTDNTWEILRQLHEKSCEVEHAGQGETFYKKEYAEPRNNSCESLVRELPSCLGIRLAHNVGQQHAIYAGLMQALSAGCDCAISLDADLQDDVDAIDEMLDAYARGDEIVYGVRDNRDVDTGFKRTSARTFYRCMRWLGVEIIPDSADFRLMGKHSLAALSHYEEVNLFLRGIVPTLGFKTSEVYYHRLERKAGTTKYSLTSMLSFALEGVTSFSIRPVRFVTLAGLLSVFMSVLMIVYSLVSIARGSVVAGWTSLMVSIWFVGGMIMVSLGVVGEYVGKTYLESKRRPRYIVSEVLE